MMKTGYLFRIRAHLKAGTYCQTVRPHNEREKLTLEQKGYHCLKTSAYLRGLIEHWKRCLNE